MVVAHTQDDAKGNDMGMERNGITEQEAREHLAASGSASIEAPRDRKIHAGGVAVFGLGMGLFTAVRTVVTGTGELALTVLFAALLAAVVISVERWARTVPRRAGWWSRAGIGLSLLVMLVAVLPWLNLRAQTEVVGVPTLALAALIVASPSLMAAGVIASRRP